MILDTNALSAWADGQVEILPPLRSARRLVLPVVALGEYLFGVFQSRKHQRHYGLPVLIYDNGGQEKAA